MNVGKSIRIMRAAKGLSQKALAEKTGMDNAYLSKIESGSVPADMEKISELAVALDVPAYALIMLGSSRKAMDNLPKDEREFVTKSIFHSLLDG